MDEALLNISQKIGVIKCKSSKLLNSLDYFVQILYIYLFKHCPVNGIRNGDEVFWCPFVRQQLAKTLITLEPHGIF